MALGKKAAKKAPPAKKTTKLTQAELVKRAMPHADIIELMSTGTPDPKPPKLGHAKAIVIVCAAANTGPGNLSRTLSQLGVNGVAFKKSVFDGVSQAGYTIPFDQIPNAPTTVLFTVVTVIQNADAV
jgi:hypothetical protein